RQWHGATTVRPWQAVEVQLDGDDNVRAWGHESLSTQAMHLAYIPFEQGDGRYVLTFDPQEAGPGLHARGVRVILHGGRLASWYRISEQRYSQIGRTAPDGTLRINTIERYEAATDGRLYATHYILAHFPAHGASLVGLTSYVNEFVEHQLALLEYRKNKATFHTSPVPPAVCVSHPGYFTRFSSANSAIPGV